MYSWTWHSLLKYVESVNSVFLWYLTKWFLDFCYHNVSPRAYAKILRIDSLSWQETNRTPEYGHFIALYKSVLSWRWLYWAKYIELYANLFLVKRSQVSPVLLFDWLDFGIVRLYSVYFNSWWWFRWSAKIYIDWVSQ
jgi:hypothetical protein